MIFTSPVDTNGTLHVSSVCLNGLNYRNLSLRFEDGCVAEADCNNYEDRRRISAFETESPSES